MGKEMASPIGKIDAAWRAMKAVGPYLIAQSDKISEAYERHKLRLADVAIYREVLTDQGHRLVELQSEIRRRYFDATDLERVRLRVDVDEVGREIRRLTVIDKALEHIAKQTFSDGQQKQSAEAKEVSPIWLDKFNEFARAHNEPWRQELLAQALAIEARKPGSVGQRALWFIGTLDELFFHAFAAIADISIFTVGGQYRISYFIPNYGKFNDRFIPTSALGPEYKLTNITFLLNDLGLFGDLKLSTRDFHAGGSYMVGYGESVFNMRPTRDIRVTGLAFTSLGDLIASLYKPKKNALGEEIFEDWIESISSDAIVTPRS